MINGGLESTSAIVTKMTPEKNANLLTRATILKGLYPCSKLLFAI
jgi:hypothetical protein